MSRAAVCRIKKLIIALVITYSILIVPCVDYTRKEEKGCQGLLLLIASLTYLIYNPNY